MPLRTGSLRSSCANALLWLGLVSSAVLPGAARAQAAPADQPPLAHYVLTASAGIPLRLGQRETFDQSAFAPAFADVLGGYVFPGQTGALRHGAGVGLSLNLTEDGGFTEPILRYDQLVITPSYLVSLRVDPAWFALAHAGIPIVATGGATFGVEAAFAFGYRLLAGFGAFAEASFDVFVGTETTLDPMIALEGGVFLDYEVLP
jgi:hypothetical protein